MRERKAIERHNRAGSDADECALPHQDDLKAS